MNEPLSALQRNADALCGVHNLFAQAAECEDSIKRFALIIAGFIALFSVYPSNWVMVVLAATFIH